MLLLRHDTPTPVCAVQLIAESCIHDSLSIRKVRKNYHNVRSRSKSKFVIWFNP